MQKNIVKLILLFSLVSYPSPGLAQATADKADDPFLSAAKTLLTGLAGAAAAYGSLKLTVFEQKQKETERKTRKKILNEELREPAPLGKDERRNSIAVIGLGGSGKTTLINRLSNDDKINIEIATDDYQRFLWSESTDHLSPKYIYYVADYVGQNIGISSRGLGQ